jgi:N-acetylneuraminic acid mutarotase
MTHPYTVHLRAAFLALVAFVIASTSLMAQWTGLPDLPAQRIQSQQAVLNGKLYVFGGFNASSVSQSTAYVLDLSNTAAGWQEIAAMPETRAIGYATAYNNKIYIVGGVGNDAGVVGRGTVLEYDPATDSYTPKAAMTTPTWYSASARAGSKIYVAGGLARIANNNTGQQITQVYDITTDSWSSGPALPAIYYYTSGAAIGNDVYVMGGRMTNSQGTYYNNSILKLAAGGSSWLVLGPMQTGVENASAGTLNGKIYVAGGTVAGSESAIGQVFDPATTSWSVYYPLPQVSSSAGALAEDSNGLYYVGGTAGKVLKLIVGTPRAVVAVSPTSINIAAKAGSSGSKIISVANLGIVALTGTVEVNASAPWLTVSPNTLNVAPATSEDITLTVDAASLATGVYNTTVDVKTNDPDNATVSVAVRVYVVDNLVEQPTNVVLEEASGSWCGPCGAYGTPEIRRLRQNYGERLITITYHDRGGTRSDPMYTAQTEAMNVRLGVTAFPTASIHRVLWPGESAQLISLAEWDPKIQTVLATTPIAPAALEVTEYNYAPGTKRVTAKIKITTADALDITGQTLRLTAVVLEDSLQYSQYGADPNEVPYYHMHAARSFWPSIDGQQITIPAGSVDNGVLLPGKEITVDASFTATGVTVPEHGEVVWILSTNAGQRLGPVLQGQEMELMSQIGGAAATIAVTPDVATKNIAVGQTATFNTSVRNLTATALEVSVDRVSNTLPTGEWSSQLCINDDCVPATANKATTTIAPGETAVFKVKIVGGTASAQGVVGIRVTAGDTTVDQTYTAITGVAGVENETGANALFSIAAYPNPITGSGRIEFAIPTATNVTMDLFASNGAKVLSLVDGRLEAGRQSITVDLSTIPAGVYTVVMKAGDHTSTLTISVVH